MKFKNWACLKDIRICGEHSIVISTNYHSTVIINSIVIIIIFAKFLAMFLQIKLLVHYVCAYTITVVAPRRCSGRVHRVLVGYWDEERAPSPAIAAHI